MSWFDEQIRLRKQRDDDSFADAISGIGSAVMGRRLTHALEEREIAQSAIEEILKYYHFKMKGDELPPSIKTVDDQLEYRMRPFGIMRREVTLEKGWYKNAVGAMLGTLKEDGSAVALIPGSFSGYTYLDLSTGKRVRLNRKTEELLDREATCFYEPLPMRSLKVPDLLRFMFRQLSAADLVLYFLIMAAVTGLGMLAPQFSKWLFGEVLESESLQVLTAVAAFMVATSLCTYFVGVFQSILTARINNKQSVAVQAAVMARVLSLKAAFFEEYGSGELMQRSQYVLSICNTLTSTVVGTTITSLFSLVYVGQIASYAPGLAVPSLLVILLTLAVSVLAAVSQMKITREEMELSAKEYGMSYAQISGIQKIKLAGAEKRMFSRWAKLFAKETAVRYNPPMFLKLAGAIITAISLTGTLIMYGIAVRTGVSVENYYAFMTCFGMVTGAFEALASITGDVANIKPSLDMAKPILAAEPEVSEGLEIVTDLRGAIELSNVCFRYNEKMPWVVDGLNLRIRAGEYVAIVGTTGCGKSTLMRLLLGFETPQKGAIYYDRRDMAKMDLRSLRRKIGVVMQNGGLFQGDIYSNIVISAPELTLDDAWEAAEVASIAEDIEAMPMGMFTIIAEGQGGISGGQKQRLMIARAVAPKPKILMFDEATSALDNVTQKKVSDAIDSLNCTRIVIAHRLSTIRNCDRIIVLDKGKIIEEGKYEKLIEKNGFFAELVKRQRLDVDDVD